MAHIGKHNKVIAVLTNMWNNRKIYILLVGVSVGKITFENCNIEDMDTLGIGHSAPREIRVHATVDMYFKMFIATSFVILRTKQKQISCICLSVREWMNNL